MQIPYLVQKNKKRFLFTWTAIFCASFTVASVLGIVPQPDEEGIDSFSPAVFAEEKAEENEVLTSNPEIPLRISIPTIGLSTPILNPNTTNIDALDRELTKGAVRYPGSGLAGSDANMFIFGHSSSLPVVINPAYKAFNDIETLSEGDEIEVLSEGKKFIYVVTTVKSVTAEEALVEFETGKPMLTLSTCDTFGAKQDRFVVEAELAGIRDI